MTLSETFRFEVIKNYFAKKGFIDHQLASFNDFLNTGIERIIKESNILIEYEDSKHTISFGEVYVSNPTMPEDEKHIVKSLYPNEARDMDLSYDSPVFVNITETIETKDKPIQVKNYRRVNIARIPIMLGSSKCNLISLSKQEKIKAGECEYDQGGYFILDGKERALVGQLRGIYNQPIVLEQKPNDKYSYICEIRSMSEESGHSVQVIAKIGRDDRTLVFSLPYIKDPIPVGVVFKALGFLTDEEIKEVIGGVEPELAQYIKFLLRDSYFIQSQDEALRFIGQTPQRVIKDDERTAYAAQVVENEIFPHMGVISTIKEKAYLLGDMVSKLLRTHTGLRQPDDRDNYCNKRVEMSGVLFFELFRTLFKKLVKNIQIGLEKKKQRPDILNLFTRNTSITLGLRHSCVTGMWSIPKATYARKGVSQILTRLSYGSFISHLRRIAIQVGKDGKNANSKIRQIDGSQIFFVDPAESPEGHQVGVVLNLALTATVSTRISTTFVKEIIKNFDYFCSPEKFNENKYPKVFLNGVLIGITPNTKEFLKELKINRQIGLLDKQISFSYNDVDNEIKIFSDEGRFIRPIFATDDTGNLKFKEVDFIDQAESEQQFDLSEMTDDDGNIDWQSASEAKKVVYSGIDFDNMVESQIIQYIDNNEIETAVVAMEPQELQKFKCDFCEITPVAMLGSISSTIPFSDHIPAARTIFQSSMGKQAIGMYALSYNRRTDTAAHVLNYGQKPLISTKPAELQGFHDMVYGTNAVVAIMTMGGFNDWTLSY